MTARPLAGEDGRDGKTDAPALHLSGLTKSFGGVPALRDVELIVERGEVHGLLGENGSGKSTLIKTLAGFHAPDAGTLSIRGEAVDLPLYPGQFRELGLSFVHQDLGLLPELSVLENLAVGRNVHGLLRGISWKSERARAARVFDAYGVDLRPDAKVGELSAVERALLAIARAANEMEHSDEDDSDGPARSGLLVLDEPTVFLPASDSDRLFELVRRIAAAGSSVLFVSHDLDEVLRITDRVTVLRDGRVHGTVVTRETDERTLIEMIVGRSISFPAAHARQAERSASMFSAHGLTGRTLRRVSFSLGRGEVLGVTGLAGSGFEEIPYLLYGAAPASAGELVVGEERIPATTLTPRRSLGHGFVLIPADRQQEGSIGTLTLADNLMMQVLDDFFVGLRLRRSKLRDCAQALCEEFDIRPIDGGASFMSLSGGNQQKAVLAKWLQTRPQALLMHEATQGVDVGARFQISARIRDLAHEGVSVLWASSDYEQLAAVCDRVIVLARGSLVAELTGGEVTKEQITERAYLSAPVEVHDNSCAGEELKR